MKRLGLWLTTIGLSIVLFCALAGPLGRPNRTPPPRSAAARAVSPTPYVGMTACATAGCHHGNGEPGAPGSEFSTYELLDPHALAFSKLRGEPARRMVREVFGDGAAPPEEQRLCVTCHDTPGAGQAPRRARIGLGEGVGCERCHGPAERWREPHSRPDWRAREPGERVALGMVPLGDPGTRARVCARCHVGSEEASVSHDLLAAGHPALFFELASFTARLPRHWQQDRDADGLPLAVERLWLAGQVEAERAECRVLAAQARNPAAPWPELTHLECGACHHDLTEPGRHRPAGPAGTAGQLIPGAWYTTALRLLLDDQPADVAARLTPVVEGLDRLDRELARGSPNRRRVAALASDLADVLPQQLELPHDSASFVAQLARPDRGRALTWGSIAQRYLAIRALSGSLPDAGGERGLQSEALLRRLRESLADPVSAGVGETVGGSRRFKPDTVRRALDDLSFWSARR
jgi:hypothetical protein